MDLRKLFGGWRRAGVSVAQEGAHPAEIVQHGVVAHELHICSALGGHANQFGTGRVRDLQVCVQDKTVDMAIGESARSCLQTRHAKTIGLHRPDELIGGGLLEAAAAASSSAAVRAVMAISSPARTMLIGSSSATRRSSSEAASRAKSARCLSMCR